MCRHWNVTVRAFTQATTSLPLVVTSVENFFCSANTWSATWSHTLVRSPSYVAIVASSLHKLPTWISISRHSTWGRAISFVKFVASHLCSCTTSSATSNPPIFQPRVRTRTQTDMWKARRHCHCEEIFTRPAWCERQIKALTRTSLFSFYVPYSSSLWLWHGEQIFILSSFQKSLLCSKRLDKKQIKHESHLIKPWKTWLWKHMQSVKRNCCTRVKTSFSR